MNTTSPGNKLTKLLRKTGGSLGRLYSDTFSRPDPIWKQTPVHEEMDRDTLDYIASNRRRWPERARTPDSPVILVSHFLYRPVIHNYAYLANYLADKHGAVLEAYCLDHRIRPYLDEVYQSFGAPLGLSFQNASERELEAVEKGTRAFEALTTKQDVVDLEVEGLRVGDFIYNWFCRMLLQPTVDLKHPTLLELIIQAHIVYYAARQYLDTHRVVAVFPNHSFYSHCGILNRLAISRGIASFSVNEQFTPTSYPPDLDEKGWPVNSKRTGPYYKYREIFQSLPEEARRKAIEQSRHVLGRRLKGFMDQKVLVHTTAWGEAKDERVLLDTDVPKILIMAHDFCDNVHKFRRMIFPDFYEWLRFLFKHARDTPYEWYLKPHPNLMLEAKNILNRRVLGELKKEFPWIHFLESGIPNGQLLSQGVKAAFTVHGTAGHEFAYLGIPVVHCGDNLHSSFDFNLHARSEEQLLGYIKNAGQLSLKIDREQIEQFCYTHFSENFTTFDGRITDPRFAYLHSQKVFELSASSAVFRYYMDNAPDDFDEVVRAHFDGYFGQDLNFLGRYRQ